MDNDRIDVTVVIPTYNDNARLALCLDALMQQSCDCRFEVIVVDNGSKDPPLLTAYGRTVRLLSEPKPGSYSARNAGLHAARGRIIAFTDSDCRPDPQWLQQGVSMLDNNPAIGVLSGQVKIFFQNPLHPKTVELFDAEFAFRQEDNARQGKAVTANLFVRREVFERVGLFNDETFSGGDYEFTSRAVAHGFSLRYCADAVVYHPARDRFDEYRRKIRRTMGGAYSMRREDPHFAQLFSPQEIAKDLLRPVKMFARLLGKISCGERSFLEVVRIMLVVLHNQSFKVVVKLAYLSGLKRKFQR